METLPHHSEKTRLPGMRATGKPPEKVRVLSVSRGTPLVGKTVSVFYHPVELIGADGVSSRTIEAIVDTGASYLSIPATLLAELGIEPTERETFVLADGREAERDIGEVRVRILGRTATTGVIFGIGSDPILLGAHALESVRLAVDPRSESLIAFTPLM